MGPLVSPVGSYIAYMEKNARLWEKQALLKARAIAGNIEMGNAVLERVAPLVYESAPAIVRADVLHSKQRIEDQLHEQGLEWGEVKLGQGSIRDVEFVAQYLQLAWGDTYPEVRSHNTLDALARLAACHLLAPEDYRVLVDGYTFLRPVEHYLQMMDYRQTHLLPGDRRELAYLARRLGFQGAQAGARFLAHYEQHAAAVRRVFRRYLEMGYEHESTTPREDEEATMPDPDRSEAAVRRHLARMTATYEATFSDAEIAHHAQLAERLDADNLVEVEATPAPGATPATWRVTLVGYDYPGELSIICGLLFAYGFNILEGDIFTYEAAPQEEAGSVGRWRAARGCAAQDRGRFQGLLGAGPGHGGNLDALQRRPGRAAATVTGRGSRRRRTARSPTAWRWRCASWSEQTKSAAARERPQAQPSRRMRRSRQARRCCTRWRSRSTTSFRTTIPCCTSRRRTRWAFYTSSPARWR